MPEPGPTLPEAVAVRADLQTGASAESRQSPLRTAAAGLIGNVLEWFDFAVYVYFSKEIGKQFFPSDDPTAEQLSAFAGFAVGFLARPVGSIVLGKIGDRIGRRALLTLSIALMGGATLGIGLLPTHAQIGIMAPILLVLLRLVQGFSLGGEFTGSMVYTTELASPLMRGLVSSSTAAGTTVGFILGSATAWLVSKLVVGHAFVAAAVGKIVIGDAFVAGAVGGPSTWAWRIPFIISVGLVVIGWFLRHGIEEPEQGQKAAKTQAPRVLEALAADWRPMVQTFGIVAMTNAAYYLVFTFGVEQRKSQLGAEGTDFQLVNTLSLFALLFTKVLGGWLSDRVGRRKLMIALTVAMMPSIYFALPVMLTGTPSEFLLGQLLMAVPLGMALGLQGAMVVEIFPLRTRVTSMSFAYSITLALSGGIAPLVAKWLNATYVDQLLPAYYIIVYGLLGLSIMLPMRETNARSLD